jgi:hypothetical protein
MNVDFLEEGSMDCPLIRIYGANTSEFSLLHRSVQQLAGAEDTSCPIHKLPGFYSDCRLTAFSSAVDIGIRKIGKELIFDWTLTPNKWSFIAGFLEPFALGSGVGAFQWLSGKEARQGLDGGEISLLVINSDDGRW